ncbi:hypothetical protein [Cryptosporangium sp. NPDC051539]|uniref:hypothetical protein n=1 Tax=Cryptosporangium sp. NPDC051539 TaxID=3363962 RepID=UPI0037922391
MDEARDVSATERQAPGETPDSNPVADPMDPTARERVGDLPPTMPEPARTGEGEQADPVDAPAGGAGGVPPGTAPEVAAALGTSESLEPVDGVHTPDVGPGGEQFDTASRPLTQRPEAAR